MQLQWLEPEPRTSSCPVCPSQAARSLVEVPHPFRAGEPLRVLRCDLCGSVFLDDQLQHVSHDEGLADDAFLTWYLESGAGIDAMLQPLIAVPVPPGGSMLDVGCGFGFTVWFAQEHLGLRAVGLERAPYGARGAALLGTQVRPAYVGDPGALDGGPFDLVHASEVVEHVPDPLAFLVGLRGACAPDGLLVLTTPDAEVVRPGSPDPVVVEALSPALHRYLLSPQRLGELLTEAGFPEQRLVRNGGHLVVWASARTVPEPAWAPLDGDLHVSVLEQLRDLGEPALARGAAYRLLREHVAAGRVGPARAALDDVRARTQRDCGVDVLDPALVRSRAAHPTFLGPLLHWAGMLTTLAEPSDVGQRVRLFADALTVSLSDVATAPQHAHEAAALVDSTRFHLVQACLQAAGREVPLLQAGPHADRTEEELALLEAVAHPPAPEPEPEPAPPAPWWLPSWLRP